MFTNLVPRVYIALRSAATRTSHPPGESHAALEANALEERILFNASPVGVAVDGAAGGEEPIMSDETGGWLVEEDYSDETTDVHDPQSGTWDVVDGQYVALPASDAVSTLQLDQPLDDNFEIEVKINADDASAQHLSNAFVIFDYESATDFKFAGAYVGVDQWVIGHRDATGWHTDALEFARVDAATDYQLRLRIAGDSHVTLYADGSPVITHSYADTLTDGQIGLGTKNAVTRYDDLRLRLLTSDTTGLPGELPLTEDFDDALADHLSPAQGDWLLVDGRYEVTPEIGGSGASLLMLADDVPDDVEIGATFEADEIAPRRFSNGVIIFDYHGETDFKYAGGFLNRDEWVIGQRTDAGWLDDVVVAAPLDAFTEYDIRVVIENGSEVSLYAGESVVASHSYGESVTDGAIGLGSNNSVTRFDDFTAVDLSPPVSKILAALEGRDLVVRGEAAGNLLVAAQHSQALQIFDRGELLYEFSELRGDLRFELGDASDHVTLDMNGHAFRGSVLVDLGDGDNELEIVDGTVNKQLRVLAGSGQDRVAFEDLNVRRNAVASLGDGTNELSVSDSRLGGHLSVQGGSGEDTVSVAEDVTIRHHARLATGAGDDAVLFAGNVGLGLFMHAGDGDDWLEFSGRSRLGSFVHMGAGDDHVALTDGATFGRFAMVNLGGGEEADADRADDKLARHHPQKCLSPVISTFRGGK